MKINSFIIPASLLLFSGCQYKQESQKTLEQTINLKPNIIYILADDLGTVI